MKKISSVLALQLALLLSIFTSNASAVPSYARQTGMSCAGCHTTFPELNAFGREFKLRGYTLTNTQKLELDKVSLSELPPISFMLQATAANKKADTPSTDVSLPNELSLFLAGRLTDDMGSFIQLTMEQGSSFEMDNADIRYARQAGSSTYGITLNNNPTVQDVWNSTPAWGFPWSGGAEVSSPLIGDGLGQNVAGLGAYAKWDNGLYTELSLYQETNGFDAPAGGITGTARLQGIAPYWRLAYEKTLGNNDTLMVGTYGIQAKLHDGDNVVAGEDKYNDVAIDTQYEHPFKDNSLLSIHASYTTEDQTLGLSSPGSSPSLDSFRLDGTYHWTSHSAATLGYIQNSGNNGAYDDTAITAQYSYLPWQNTKYSVQYTSYSKLAGNSGVSDENTLLLQAWLMW